MSRYLLSEQPHIDSARGRWCVTQRDGNPYLWYRIVMWDLIGRELGTDEHVHHINDDKTDDRPENLAILSPTEHTRLHMALRPSRKVELVCHQCSETYLKYPSTAKGSLFCSRACRAAAQAAGTFLTGRALRKARLVQS